MVRSLVLEKLLLQVDFSERHESVPEVPFADHFRREIEGFLLRSRGNFKQANFAFARALVPVDVHPALAGWVDGWS